MNAAQGERVAFWRNCGAGATISPHIQKASSQHPGLACSCYAPAMCGPFTQQLSWAELHRLADLIGQPRNLRPRYNIALIKPFRQKMRISVQYWRGPALSCLWSLPLSVRRRTLTDDAKTRILFWDFFACSHTRFAVAEIFHGGLRNK